MLWPFARRRPSLCPLLVRQNASPSPGQRSPPPPPAAAAAPSFSHGDRAAPWLVGPSVHSLPARLSRSRWHGALRHFEGNSG
ncbi:hypothetical protein GQ55_9G435300 [Panicum hallii var. hallii]|uniref:Uncharacterized protein n=1 Tax=Panicum hallii var. hallii TaxID=1504633 RepID=A0A2T7CB64_9POAL|nr:hypothetical protein GQ55_9G435300 [Panicum hallii var. hallii]